MSKKQIDLSIIVISLSTDKYHTKDSLEITLKSLNPALQKLNYEVILVDNSNVNDGTEKMANEYIKNLIYLKRDGVYSFCSNNNYGLKNVRGRYVLFLNNDVKFLDNNILSEMVEWMDKNNNIGVVGPKLLNSDSITIQPSGGLFPNLFNVIGWMLFFNSKYHPKGRYYQKEQHQDWITGAFYLTRSEILNNVGGFDETYGAYVEEVDLSYRIKKIGYKIMYMPKWKVVHFGGLSYGNKNSLIYELKNLKFFYKKHYPKWQLPILNLTIKLGCLLRIIVFSIFRPNLVKVYAKAIKII